MVAILPLFRCGCDRDWEVGVTKRRDDAGPIQPAHKLIAGSSENFGRDKLFRLGRNLSPENNAPNRPSKYQSLIDALIAVERQKLAKLCDRLGIDKSLDEAICWALVGRVLAQGEPEFATKKISKPKQGRPRKAKTKTEDIIRATIIAHAAKDWYASRAWDGAMLSQTAWIEVCRQTGNPLFTKASRRRLQNSVSAGLKELNICLDDFTKK